MGQKVVKMVSPTGAVSSVVLSAFERVWEPRGYTRYEPAKVVPAAPLIEELDESTLSDDGKPSADDVPPVPVATPVHAAPRFGRHQSEQTGTAESDVSGNATTEES